MVSLARAHAGVSQHSSTPCNEQGHTNQTQLKSIPAHDPSTNSALNMGSHKLNNNQPESIAQQDESSKFWDRSVLKRSSLDGTARQDTRQRRRKLPDTLGGGLRRRKACSHHPIRRTLVPPFNQQCQETNAMAAMPLKHVREARRAIADAAIPDSLARGFREAPTMLTAANRQLHDRILFYISNAKAVEDYEKKSNGNFITLVGILSPRRTPPMLRQAPGPTMRSRSSSRQGLPASIVCFDQFRLQFDSLNAMCKVGRHDPEAVVATILTDIVKDFGDIMATKLEMKLDAAGATGDLEKTVSVIHRALGKIEGKTLGNARRSRQAERRCLRSCSSRLRPGSCWPRSHRGRRSARRARGGDRDDYIPPVWTVGKHDLCDLCTPCRSHAPAKELP